MKRFVLYFDGSSFDKGRRGGPGVSAGAAVLIDEDGSVWEASQFLRVSESNAAEYSGLICGLELALSRGVQKILIRGDSRNVIDQVLGLKVPRKPELIRLRETAMVMLEQFVEWQLEWIPRRKNSLADEAARQCIAGQRQGA